MSGAAKHDELSGRSLQDSWALREAKVVLRLHKRQQPMGHSMTTSDTEDEVDGQEARKFGKGGMRSAGLEGLGPQFTQLPRASR